MTQNSQATAAFSSLAANVGMIPTRELICVWAGLKTARVGGCEVTIELIEQCARQLGLASVRSTKKYKNKRDIGKGGWSNKFGGSLPLKASEGDWLLYLGRSHEAVMKARKAEEDEREFDFGGELGIPDCCARFYVQHRNKAMEKQNDYVPFVLRNTVGRAPYEPLLNYVAQYFGYSLISFFPCSFNCERAMHIARRSYNVVKALAPALARETLRFQRMPMLYTEYRGIFAFESARYDAKKRRLIYDPKRIHGTLPLTSAIFRVLRQGSCLELPAKDHVRILNGRRCLSILEGDNVSACIF